MQIWINAVYYTRFTGLGTVFLKNAAKLVFFLLSFDFSTLHYFGKITSYLLRDNLQAPDVSLAI